MPEAMPQISPRATNVDATAVQRERPVPAPTPLPEDTRKKQSAVKEAGTRDQVRQAVEHLNKAVKTLELEARFRIVEDPHQVVIQMVDSENGDVVREIPPQRLLEMYADMIRLVGLALDRKA